MRAKDDHVVEEAQRLRIVARHHLVDHLHQLMRAQNFAGVQSAVDPHHGLAFVSQRAGLIVRESFGECELARDFLVSRQMLMIFGRGQDRHPLRTPFFRLPDLHQLHAVGLGGQLLPPGRQLRVIGQVVIVADVESERFLRRGDVTPVLRVERGGEYKRKSAGGQFRRSYAIGD